MQLSKISNYAVRLAYAQSNIGVRLSKDRLVGPSAFLLAGLGIAVSSFGVVQLSSNKNHQPVRRLTSV